MAGGCVDGGRLKCQSGQRVSQAITYNASAECVQRYHHCSWNSIKCKSLDSFFLFPGGKPVII